MFWGNKLPQCELIPRTSVGVKYNTSYAKPRFLPAPQKPRNVGPPRFGPEHLAHPPETQEPRNVGPPRFGPEHLARPPETQEPKNVGPPRFGPEHLARRGCNTRHGLPHSTAFAVFEKRAAFPPRRPDGTQILRPSVESSAVENSTPRLPFRVAGSKGERLPTLYPEHLARRRRRVPGAALDTVSPTALFSLYL